MDLGVSLLGKQRELSGTGLEAAEADACPGDLASAEC